MQSQKIMAHLLGRFFLTKNLKLRTNDSFNSPCGEETQEPAEPASSAARSPALPGSSVWRGCTSLFQGTRGRGCSAESDAARSGAPPWLVRARESLPRTGPTRSDTRRCRCKGCRTPDRARWRACIPQWLLQCAPGNDRSSPGRYEPRPWDGAPETIDTAHGAVVVAFHLCLISVLQNF